MQLDILSIIVILFDLGVSSFLMWRATSKKATLWGSARLIYVYITLMTLYHAVIYVLTLFATNTSPEALLSTYLHPFVFLYILNPGLIAIMHWRGGHIL